MTILELKKLRVGVLLSLLTLAFGFGLGAFFGAAESSLKGHLAAEGQSATSGFIWRG